MNRVSLLWGTVCVAAVAGCASVAPDQPAGMATASRAPAAAPAPAVCGGAPLKPVKIKDMTVVGSDVTIKIPAQVVINKNKAGVVWTLETAGYEFAQGAISFKADQPGGITGPQQISRTEYAWCFDSTRESTWSYDIFFKTAAANSPTWHCDPTIVNSGTMVEQSEPVVTCKPLP